MLKEGKEKKMNHLIIIIKIIIISNLIIQRTVLVIRQDGEPRAVVAVCVQCHTHRVALHKTREALVDREKLVALKM